MAPDSQNDDVSSKLSSLDLNKTKSAKKSVVEEVADSWEDEDVSDSDGEPTTPKAASTAPAAPPPTPSTPSFGVPDSWGNQSPTGSSPSSARDGRRPEKTDAVARRLIAAGLGLKAPKQTDEQRAYQKSVREQERKRRDQERSEQQQRAEASEKAKAAMWDA